MTKSVSRRAALAGIAALAPAVAAAALPAAPVDPVFAAIERHKTLLAEAFRLNAEVDEAEDAAERIHGRRPSALVRWRDRYGSEIDVFHDRLLREGTVEPATIEREYRKVKARLQARIEAGTAWDDLAGVEALRRREEESWRAVEAAREDLQKMRPTTPAGGAAMVDHMLALFEDHHTCNEWHCAVLATAARALSGMPATIA